MRKIVANLKVNSGQFYANTPQLRKNRGFAKGRFWLLLLGAKLELFAIGLVQSIGLPRKQKIAVKHFWVQESEIGENADNSGREFWA